MSRVPSLVQVADSTPMNFLAWSSKKAYTWGGLFKMSWGDSCVAEERDSIFCCLKVIFNYKVNYSFGL